MGLSKDDHLFLIKRKVPGGAATWVRTGTRILLESGREALSWGRPGRRLLASGVCRAELAPGCAPACLAFPSNGYSRPKRSEPSGPGDVIVTLETADGNTPPPGTGRGLGTHATLQSPAPSRAGREAVLRARRQVGREVCRPLGEASTSSCCFSWCALPPVCSPPTQPTSPVSPVDRPL
ncbi:unnamed protein product [Rangifer tarandus platyrhynchus]|uniref:Uncharacterized protein n=2 Tax=Rangifer tarandus platyrhynchus TaxID=3082113 RepID=A0ACB0EGM8_RANTA|nr:unnamed protein product [Rangifer tarandus platyrhynchus]CAI9699731.1 unnamed protein product [Rangifer tarandus platyrhynchus]